MPLAILREAGCSEGFIEVTGRLRDAPELPLLSFYHLLTSLICGSVARSCGDASRTARAGGSQTREQWLKPLKPRSKVVWRDGLGCLAEQAPPANFTFMYCVWVGGLAGGRASADRGSGANFAGALAPTATLALATVAAASSSAPSVAATASAAAEPAAAAAPLAMAQASVRLSTAIIAQVRHSTHRCLKQ